MSFISRRSQLVLPGSKSGFYVFYNTSTSVLIRSGFYEVDGTLFILPADIAYPLTGLVSAAGFSYIYAKKIVADPSIPEFIDSLTVPVWDFLRRGWYNGDDRLIGVVYSPASSSTIEYFDTNVVSENLIRNSINRKTLIVVGSPTGSYMSTTTEASVFLPKNAVEAMIYMQNSNPAGIVELGWRNSEGAAINTQFFRQPTFEQGGEAISVAIRGPLGSTQNVKVAGAPDDDNQLFAAVKEYGYSR